MNKESLLIKNFLKYKWDYIMGIICLSLKSYFEVYIPRLIGLITDRLVEGGMSVATLNRLIIQVLICVVLITIAIMGSRYYMFGTPRKIERDIQNKIFEKWLICDSNYFSKHKSGSLMAYITGDLNMIRTAMGNGCVELVNPIILISAIIGSMCIYVNLKLTIVALIPMILIILSATYFEKKIEGQSKERQQAFSNLSDRSQETFLGIGVIKAFVQEPHQIDWFKDIASKHSQSSIDLTRTSAFLISLINLLVGMSFLITIGYGGYLTMGGTITVGQFITFSQYILLLGSPLDSIARGVNLLAQGIASAKRVESILEEEPLVKDEETTKAFVIQKGDITINNLTFRFPGSKQAVLQDINLNISSGETIGILGSVGSGKTTLVDLLVRMYNVPKNTIFIDGQDIMDVTVESIRQGVAYVTQENILFSKTIAHNIGLGVDKINQKEIIEVAKQMVIHDEIISFEEQYDTLIGERGAKLSGGQKQRLAIARSLIIDAPILVLDDALSAVDAVKENQIIKNIAKLRRGKTTLIVAHRVSTLQKADRIIILNDGRIIEEGNREELLNLNGVYAQMYRMQQLEQQVKEVKNR